MNLIFVSNYFQKCLTRCFKKRIQKFLIFALFSNIISFERNIINLNLILRFSWGIKNISTCDMLFEPQSL